MNTVPYQPLYELQVRGKTQDSFNYGFLVAISLGVLPLNMISFIIYERENGLKHM